MPIISESLFGTVTWCDSINSGQRKIWKLHSHDKGVDN